VPITFRRLPPSPGDPAGLAEILAGLGLVERSAYAPAAGGGSGAPSIEGAEEVAGRTRRPYVVLNMVATLDGRATLEGRSGPISDPADRALFHGLRSVVDAVAAGAGTVRTERYGPIVADPGSRRRRLERGLREQPLACVISASLVLAPDLPLLADPGSRVVIVTPSEESLPGTAAAHVEYVRARREDGSLDLAAALGELHDRLHVGTLLCEGGPHLNTELLAGGLVDELFLSIAPLLLAGGDPTTTHDDDDDKPPLRILAGPELQPPVELELRSALEHDSRLFLRYRVRDGG
jgi:riboflavin-specific deaminase-like protein